MDSCIFCKIVKGDVPSYKVWEDESYLAFLNIFPFKEGHTLLIPKKHTDYVFDLPDEELSGLMIAAKKVSVRLKKVFTPKTEKIGVVIAGEEVHHVHMHLIPFDVSKDLSFSSAHKVSNEELAALQSRLKQF